MKNRRLYVCMILVMLSLVMVSMPTASWGFATASSTQAASSLCEQNEKIVFSCPVKSSNKIVSLCASRKLTKTEGYLQYRFGLPGKVELEYPKQHGEAQKAFRYSHYFRAQVDSTEISFSIDGYGYTVFDNYNGEEKPAIAEQGVTVTPPTGKKDVTYSCKGRAKIDFGELPDVLENVSSPQQ